MTDTTAQRFWSKVRVGNRTECWLWRGASANRYAAFRFNGGVIKAHRMAYMFAHGPIPEGMHVLHRCDTPLCCNPDHLWLGTHVENMRDRNMKDRQARGEKNGKTRLTDVQIKHIRMLAGTARYSYRELGEMYGMSSGGISDIVNNKTRKKAA